MENKDTNTQIEDVVISDNQKYLIDKYETDEEPKNRVEYDVINEEIKEANDENYLYPNTSDPNFSLKIANKMEFSKTFKSSSTYQFHIRNHQHDHKTSKPS